MAVARDEVKKEPAEKPVAKPPKESSLKTLGFLPFSDVFGWKPLRGDERCQAMRLSQGRFVVVLVNGDSADLFLNENQRSVKIGSASITDEAAIKKVLKSVEK